MKVLGMILSLSLGHDSRTASGRNWWETMAVLAAAMTGVARPAIASSSSGAMSGAQNVKTRRTPNAGTSAAPVPSPPPPMFKPTPVCARRG